MPISWRPSSAPARTPSMWRAPRRGASYAGPSVTSVISSTSFPTSRPMKHSKAPEQQFWQQVRGQLGLVEPPLAELEKRLAAADDDALSAEQIERMVNRAVAAEAKPEPVLTETLMPKVSRGRRWLLRASAVVGIPTMVLATVLWVEGRESRRTMDLVLATRIISETDQPLQDTNTALGYTRTRVDRGLMGLHALQHDPNSTLASAAAQALSELRIAYSNQS